MFVTDTTCRREATLKSKWDEQPNGYATMQALNEMGQTLCYVALPDGHPDIGSDYGNHQPDVNGGLTYGSENVFGWDYAHYENHSAPFEDIQNALCYFRKREVSKGKEGQTT